LGRITSGGSEKLFVGERGISLNPGDNQDERGSYQGGGKEKMEFGKKEVKLCR